MYPASKHIVAWPHATIIYLGDGNLQKNFAVQGTLKLNILHKKICSFLIVKLNQPQRPPWHTPRGVYVKPRLTF